MISMIIIVVVNNMAVGTAVRLQSLDHHVNCPLINYTFRLPMLRGRREEEECSLFDPLLHIKSN